ncbi:secreted protein [Candidatus Magnetomorum sp. HK-1]|nr:secreted protein [Candidatus Magnetomorum sp. HK-1]
MQNVFLLFILTAISFGCAAEEVHLTKHVLDEKPQVECSTLKNVRLAIIGFTSSQNSNKMLLDEAIREESINDSCQWLSFVKRARVNNTKQYLRTIYQEVLASYEGYTSPGNRLSVTPQRLEEIQTQILRVGRPESLTDDIFKISLTELKKNSAIDLEKNGAIPQAFIPQLGKLWQADAILYGSYVITDHIIHLSVNLDHVASGKKLLNKKYDYQCVYLPDCKKQMAKLILIELRNHFPVYSQLLIDAQPHQIKQDDQPKHENKMDNRIKTVEAKAFGSTQDQAERLALIQALKKVKPIYLDEYTKLLGNVLAEHIIQQRITGYINEFEVIHVEQIN